jgi:hypothetical protein
MRVAFTVSCQLVGALMGVKFRPSIGNAGVHQSSWLTIVNVTRRMRRNLHLAELRGTLGRHSGSVDTAMMKATDTITVIEGYDAMRIFLEAVWRRHDKPIEEIAFLLRSLKWADGSPVDPTMWQDWLAAVQIVVSAGRCTRQVV